MGVALCAGHPVYFVIFFRDPEPGQTLVDVCKAEQRFVRKVRALHPNRPKPAIVGNCQGGRAVAAFDVRVVVSYEAGQDGFWILRSLRSRGIDCYMVGAASIPVERHKRRAKTDRLDVINLVTNLRAWLHGERDRMHMVHAPSLQDEASRYLIRDRGQLQKEVMQHRDRMRKLLVTVGCWDEVDHRAFAKRLACGELTCHDGAPLPDELCERLPRESHRLELAEQQLADLERTLQDRLPGT